jgi:hypothetical protein
VRSMRIAFTLTLFVLFLAACGSDSADGDSPQPDAPATHPPASTTVSDTDPPPTTATEEAATRIVGTVVRFTSDSTSVDVTIGEDNPAVRDFLSMLPMTINVEEYAGREKISYLSRELRHAGSPGSDPENGDLIYFVPWGNLGFYYNAAGIGHSDDTIHVGTYDASLDQLAELEGEVTVATVD